MKNINRKVILRKRNRLSKDQILSKSKAIEQALFDSREYKDAKTVMFYVSFGSEVDTGEMIKESLKDKIVCVPCIKDGLLLPSQISDAKDLSKKNVYGICEPCNVVKIEKDKIDLIIVPGVVFDKHGHRIGYGKGYYDNFLKNYKGKKIGLAFKLQVLEDIPKDEWDIMLDKVISHT